MYISGQKEHLFSFKIFQREKSLFSSSCCGGSLQLHFSDPVYFKSIFYQTDVDINGFFFLIKKAFLEISLSQTNTLIDFLNNAVNFSQTFSVSFYSDIIFIRSSHLFVIHKCIIYNVFVHIKFYSVLCSSVLRIQMPCILLGKYQFCPGLWFTLALQSGTNEVIIMQFTCLFYFVLLVSRTPSNRKKKTDSLYLFVMYLFVM